MHQNGIFLVYGRLSTLRGEADRAAVEQALRRGAPRLYGRELGRRTVALSVPGRVETLVGVSFAAGLKDSLPFSSTDLREDRRRTRAIDLPELVAEHPTVTLHDDEGWWVALSGSARVGHLYVVAGLPPHACVPVGFDELRRGERLWIGQRTATLTSDVPLVKLDLERRDSTALVLQTCHPEAAVRDLVSLHTFGELAEHSVVAAAPTPVRQAPMHSAEGSALA